VWIGAYDNAITIIMSYFENTQNICIDRSLLYGNAFIFIYSCSNSELVKKSFVTHINYKFEKISMISSRPFF